MLANLYLNEAPNNNPFFVSKYQFKQAELLLKKWGEINKHDASEKLHQINSVSMQEMKSIYFDTFGNYPNLNFIGHIASFVSNPNEYKFIRSHTHQPKTSPHFFSNTKETGAPKDEPKDSSKPGFQ